MNFIAAMVTLYVTNNIYTISKEQPAKAQLRAQSVAPFEGDVPLMKCII